MSSKITLSQSFPPIAKSVQHIAKNVMNASQLTDLRLGVVVSVTPLRIRIDQKTEFTDEYLILTNAVKDHAVDVSVSWQTVDDEYLKPNHTHGNGNDGNPTTDTTDFDTKHHHDIKGRKKIIIHNGLTVGEKVLLLRTQGGQYYIVIDRVDEIPIEGEWL